MESALCRDSRANSDEAVTTLGDILLDKDILLESGTNELEALVFDVGNFTFAINVAKVREVLRTPRITPLAKSHPSIRGAFSLRDRVIPCISLARHLSTRSLRPEPESHLVLTEINQQQTAFLVDEVHHIHRISWEHILPVPDLYSLTRCPVTALTHCDERLVLLLDFEQVLHDVTGAEARMGKIANPQGVPRETMRILMIEDSPTVRNRAGNILRASGYEQVLFFNNGAEAWQWLEERVDAAGQLGEIADLVISDVEMPQVDGFHLTKRIKGHPVLSRLPVLLYSSIITHDNYKKGTAVGADAQITKPELDRVVELADRLIAGESGVGEERGGAKTMKRAPAAGPDDAVNVDAKAAEPLQPEAAPRDSTVPDPAPLERGAPSPAAEPTAGTARASAPAPEQECTSPPAMPELHEIDLDTWERFHQELIGNVGELRRIIVGAASGSAHQTWARGAARTLHSIKAAADVIPVKLIVQRTHQAESRLEGCQTAHEPAAMETLRDYADWLAGLVQLQTTTDDHFETLARFIQRLKNLDDANRKDPWRPIE